MLPKFLAVLLAFAALAGLAGPAAAQRRDTTAIAAGFEGAASPGVGGYGWVLVRHDIEGALPRSARLSVEYNTDTLRLTIDRARFDRVELAAQIFGEALLAGILDDYFRDGKNDRGRGFFSSYLGAAIGAKVDLAPHFLELVLQTRRLFFGHDPGTDDRFILPADAWVGEVRLRYTYWGLKPDVSLWEAQRMFWRVRGVAVGVELSADLRSDVHPWGARDPGFAPLDPRNDPSRVIAGVHQWLRAGVKVHDRVRLQLREEAHWLWGADDLVRYRIGGQNPYSVPLVGAPWGGYLADRLIAAEGSIHVRVKDEHEVGLLVDGVLTTDVRRVGDETAHLIAGIGAFADLRWKRLQIDARVGWSPTVQPGRTAGGYSALVSLGWRR